MIWPVIQGASAGVSQAMGRAGGPGVVNLAQVGEHQAAHEGEGFAAAALI